MQSRVDCGHLASGLEKVTAFVTRGDGAKRELLVFRHPTAGVQVPAGTVELNESIEAAVLREVKEETGLTNVVVLAKLVTLGQQLKADQRVLLRPVRLRAGPENKASFLPFNLTRGLTVRVIGTYAAHAKIAYEEYDLRQAEPLLTERQTGWVPLDVLASHVERHLFHLKTISATPDHWSVPSDRGHVFQLHWVPLSQRPVLVRGQDIWLACVYDHLLPGEPTDRNV